MYFQMSVLGVRAGVDGMVERKESWKRRSVSWTA